MCKKNGVSFLESIGAFVRRKRKERGIGLRAFALVCEVSPTAMGRVENNEDLPSADLCDRIANALDLLAADRERIFRRSLSGVCGAGTVWAGGGVDRG